MYCSFSGGKDSTVLLHLIRREYPNVPAVFSNTGLEFPEIREFVLSTPNVTVIKPKTDFRRVIEKHGYPVISKEQSDWIYYARKGRVWAMRKFNNSEAMCTVSKKWQYLANAPFKIGKGCCYAMKKSPFRKYERETKRVPFIGTMACESMLREQQWLEHGCNAFDTPSQGGVTRPKSQPLSFWTEADIWEYIRTFDVTYSTIYDKGYTRTGCIFCMFGVHLESEPNRFQRLQITHPQLWQYCMKDWENGGLGLKKVLEYINVKWRN